MVRIPGTRVSRIVAWLSEPPHPWPAFTSPLRSTKLTSLLGIALAVAFGVCFLTGVLSHLIQHPPGWFWWPSRPAGLYRFTQGLHVATGLATVPLLGAKLWSVYPRLFTWPPLRGAAHTAERLAVAALVAAALFQVVSGVLNTAYWYAPMPFFFTAAHYWVAWLAIGALLTHIGVQLPVVRAALRRPAPSVPPIPDGAPPADGSQLAPEAPRPLPEDSRPASLDPRQALDAGLAGRRQVLVAVGAAAGVITLATAGQTVRPLAAVSVLAPRRPGTGPQGLPVNRTAAAAGVRGAALDPAYRLTVTGFGRTIALSTADLAALPQHTAILPIACVEGWSAVGTWAGVRLRDLATMLGADPEACEAVVESLQETGRYRASTVAAPHLSDPATLVALRLGGEPLALDHGFPSRLIAPNRPGVLQTKWLARITLRSTS